MNSIFQNRQTIKPSHFTGEKLDDALVQQLLDLAKFAPTHKLTEPWHFVVFTGEGLNRLGQFTAELYQKHTPESKFLDKKYQKYLHLGKSSSHIIAICMKRDSANRLPEIEEVCAVACAVQNMHLGCHDLGIGGYWSTGGATYYKEVIPFLGLSEIDTCLGFFYLGKPVDDLPNRTKRTDMSNKTNWITS